MSHTLRRVDRSEHGVAIAGEVEPGYGAATLKLAVLRRILCWKHLGGREVEKSENNLHRITGHKGESWRRNVYDTCQTGSTTAATTRPVAAQ